jgi:hypothetical protein
MKCKKYFPVGIAAALLLTSASALADTVLASSNFDNLGTPGQTDYNFTGFQFITVTGGSVDLVQSGDINGITCAGGSGKCIDLDGTSGAAGEVSIASLGGFRDGVYKVSFELSGNQRGQLPGGSDPDVLTLTFGNVTKTFSLAPNDPFQLISFAFRVDALNPVSSIVFGHSGADNVGMILDNASLTLVPLPATALLFASAMGALSAFRRRQVSTA